MLIKLITSNCSKGEFIITEDTNELYNIKFINRVIKNKIEISK